MTFGQFFMFYDFSMTIFIVQPPGFPVSVGTLVVTLLVCSFHNLAKPQLMVCWARLPEQNNNCLSLISNPGIPRGSSEALYIRNPCRLALSVPVVYRFTHSSSSNRHCGHSIICDYVY